MAPKAVPVCRKNNIEGCLKETIFDFSQLVTVINANVSGLLSLLTDVAQAPSLILLKQRR